MSAAKKLHFQPVPEVLLRASSTRYRVMKNLAAAQRLYEETDDSLDLTAYLILFGHAYSDKVITLAYALHDINRIAQNAS